MAFAVDPETGLGFARDRRDQAYVVQNSATHGAEWALHLGKRKTILFSSLRQFLGPLVDSQDLDRARAAYDEWLAWAPVERARLEEERRREEAEQEARELEARQREQRRKEQEAREAASRAQFVELLAEFEIDGWATAPLLPLLPILLRLRERHRLGDDDLAWLRSQRLFSLAAHGHETAYHQSGDVWQLVQACANYRRAGIPERSLAVSEGARTLSAPPQARAALFTTRGGAQRDLRDHRAAIESAEAALRVQPSGHAYALLGGIYFDLGDLAKADMYFDKADASETGRDGRWRSEMKAAPEHQRTQAALFLLEKDPERYSWARAYISPPAV